MDAMGLFLTPPQKNYDDFFLNSKRSFASFPKNPSLLVERCLVKVDVFQIEAPGKHR